MPYISNVNFSINNMNNGLLNSVKSMPQKDSTTDGTDNFAIYRNEFVRTYPISNMNDIKDGKIMKKWYGNVNRDSSSYTREKQINGIGGGSLNANNKPFSFTTVKDVNTVNSALRRVRAGGAVAPLKKSNAQIYGKTPGFPTGKLVRTQYNCNNTNISHCNIPQYQSNAKIQQKTALAYKINNTNNSLLFH